MSLNLTVTDVLDLYTPRATAFGSPALLAKPGGCATRPNKPHKTRLVAELKQCSPKTPVLAVLLGVVQGEIGDMAHL